MIINFEIARRISIEMPERLKKEYININYKSRLLTFDEQ